MLRPEIHYPHVTWAHVMLRPGTLFLRRVSSCDVKAGNTLFSRQVSSRDVKAGDTLSSRHVSSCDVKAGDTLFSRQVSSRDVKAGDTLFSRHVSSCDVNACSWDVRSGFSIEIYGADSHFCHSAYVTWSRVGLWSAHVPARLSNFCCRTHLVRRDLRIERSSDVTSCFQKWRKCLLKKCANGPFYMKPSHQIM